MPRPLFFADTFWSILAKTLSVFTKTLLKTLCVFKTLSVLLKTLSVFKSVFIFPINLRNAQKYFGEATHLRTIFQIRGFLCLPVGGDQVNHEVSPTDSSTCWYNSVPLAIHIRQTNTFRKYSRVG